MDEQDVPNEAVSTPTPSAAPPPPPSAVPAGKSRPAMDWRGNLILFAGAGAFLVGLFGSVGAGWGLWGWPSGLKAVQWAFFVAVGTIALGLFFWWRGKKTGIVTPRSRRWLGMFFAIIYAGWIGTYLFAALTVPAIHDISTDLADPPTFRVLTLRPDNLDEVPGGTDAKMKGLNPQQRWVVVHQKSYGNIRSVRINEPVPNVIAKAERLAKARGWDIAVALPEEGRLEATETSALFRFKDDVVLRVRPTETGDGSIVDMRSVSRVGVNDLGVNAKRVRSFLADLSGTVTAAP